MDLNPKTMYDVADPSNRDLFNNLVSPAMSVGAYVGNVL